MRVKITRHPSYWILRCEWSTTGLLPGPIPEVVSAVKRGLRGVILNLSDVEFINSIGVKSIIESIRFGSTHNSIVALCEPSLFVRRALKLNGLSGAVPIFISEIQAQLYMDRVSRDGEPNRDFYDRILIGQNEIEIARDLRKACHKHPLQPKFKLIPIRSIKQASNLLNSDRMDCVMLDSTFDLKQVSQLIEDTHCGSNHQDIPIIIVSAEDSIRQAGVMVRNGATDIIRYPFSPIDAVTRVQTLICMFKDRNTFIPPEEVVHPWGTR